MRPLLVLLFALVGFSALAQKTINDPNVETRNVGSFHAIDVSGAFKVVLTQGGSESVAVSANHAEDVPHIRTRVENGVLKIDFQNSKKWWPKNRQLRAYISVKNLDVLNLGGASDLRVEGSVQATSLKMNVSGASQLTGRFAVSQRLTAILSGASDLNLTGSANDAVVRASGASRLKAYDFSTSVCDVHASGASKVQIAVDKELSADLSGASSISYAGKAVIRDIKTSGASSISRKS